jgi:hypothetical protein
VCFSRPLKINGGERAARILLPRSEFKISYSQHNTHVVSSEIFIYLYKVSGKRLSTIVRGSVGSQTGRPSLKSDSNFKPKINAIIPSSNSWDFLYDTNLLTCLWNLYDIYTPPQKLRLFPDEEFHPYEMTQLANLCCENVEEAKSLIPRYIHYVKIFFLVN